MVLTRLLSLANVDQHFNVLHYASGVAINDGSAHPLSGTFATLLLAQAVYPAATALTESLAWHAHYNAIAAAKANKGGTVYSPAGIYLMSPCPGALKFPMNSNFDTPPAPTTTNCQVDWAGDGRTATSVRWTVDFGSTPNPNATGSMSYAVMCGTAAGDPTGVQASSRYAADTSAISFGEFRDLTIGGPTAATDTASNLGVAGCNLSGLCWASRRRLTRVGFQGFYAGIDVVGDHTPFDDIDMRNNYYNMYVNHNSATLYGDLFIGGKSAFEDARMASVGIAYGGNLPSWHFSGRVFMGGSPFLFFKEKTPGSPIFTAVTSLMGGCQFDAWFGEGVGNYYFWDDNYSDGQAIAYIDSCDFTSVTFSSFRDDRYLSTYKRGIAQVGTIDGGSWRNVTIWPPLTGFAAGVICDSLIEVNTILGEFTIEGNIESLLTACAAADIAPIRILNNNRSSAGAGLGNEVYAPRIKLRHSRGDGSCGPWEGRFWGVYEGSPAVGDYMQAQYVGAHKSVLTNRSANLGVCRSLPRPNVTGSYGGAITGTVATTAASAAVVGTGTAFTTDLAVGQWIIIQASTGKNVTGKISAIADNTHLTLAKAAMLTLTSSKAGVLYPFSAVAETGLDVPYNGTGTDGVFQLKKVTDTAGKLSDAVAAAGGIVGASKASGRIDLFGLSGT